MSTHKIYRLDDSEKEFDVESQRKPLALTPIRIRHQAVTIVMAIVTALLMSFTIFFAYNSCLQNPMLPLFVSQSPTRSIVILNVASHLTLCALAELTCSVFDAIRWALACQGSGTTALTFLTLSRATSLLGSMYLSLGKSEMPHNSLKNDHRVWGIQRILLALLRIALGVVLLADVSFKPSYNSVFSIGVTQAGISQLNASFAHTSIFSAIATNYFYFYYPSSLSDGKFSHAVDPVTCSGPSCQGFYFPGPTSIIQFDPNQPNITDSLLPQASAFIQYDSPGYQIDFSPIDTLHDPAITLEDCHVYGIDGIALQLCLKDFNGSFVAAWSSCPLDVGYNNMCRNSSDWRESAPFNTKMTITNRRATTIFNRANYTILDVTDLSNPTPTNYTAEDIFGFYDVIMNVNLTQTNWQFSSSFGLFEPLADYLRQNQDNELDSGGGSREARLQAYLATPWAIFNNAWLGMPDDTSVMGKRVGLAVPGYRLVIAPATLYLFMIGGLISLLWCLVALPFAMAAMSPKTSFYPEVDFASKVTAPKDPELYPRNSIFRESITTVLASLSNATSREIRNGLAGSKLYVRVHEPEDEEVEGGTRRVTIISENAGSRLSHRDVEELAWAGPEVERMSQRFSRTSYNE